MAHDQPTSPTLLQRARQRDESAWNRLVELYSPLVAAWCRSAGLRGAEAEDVAQEVFLAVSAGLEGFRRQGQGHFRAWVRGITRHKLLDRYRGRQRQPAEAAGGTSAFEAIHNIADPVMDSAQDQAERGGLYRRALGQIRGEFEPRTWEAFWRAGVEGEDTTAVASSLGMTPTAVRIAKSRVLARLRMETGDLID
jgi:RNA polymerase sigma-70 factor (ECF subfamily)